MPRWEASVYGDGSTPEGYSIIIDRECEAVVCGAIPTAEAVAICEIHNAELSSAAGLGRVHHKKRGTTYIVGGEAELQTSSVPLVDGSEMMVYKSEDTGKVYVRHKDEFEDGRFEVLD